MISENGKYLDLMNFHSPDEAYEEVKKLASDLTNDEHQIRSCIFDMHAAVELELRRIYYHTFRRQLFLTDDDEENALTLGKFEKSINRLGFMEMYRLLRPVLQSWPYPDFECIQAINDTRNQAAHG